MGEKEDIEGLYDKTSEICSHLLADNYTNKFFFFLLEYSNFINHLKICKKHPKNMRPQSGWEFPQTIQRSHPFVLQIGLKCGLAYCHPV